MLDQQFFRRLNDFMFCSFFSITGLSIDGDPISPIIHLRLAGNYAEKSRDEQEKILLAIVDEVRMIATNRLAVVGGVIASIAAELIRKFDSN